MAWRNPGYGYLNHFRTLGASAISSANAFSTTQPEDHLVDDRAGSLCTFAAAATGHYIQFDRSATPQAGNRLWIPSGHNMSGWDVRVRAATDASITTSVTTLVDPAVAYTEGGAGGQAVPAGALDFVTATNTQRYIRIDWPNEVTINPEIGELFYTFTLTPTRGPEPGWIDSIRSNVLVQTLSSGGEYAYQRGVNRREFAFRYRAVTNGTDIVILDAIADVGLGQSILLDPPFDTESAVWCRLSRDVRRVQDPAVPATTDAPESQYQLELIEHVA